MISRTNIIILVLGITIGATVNGWRLNGEIKEIKAEHAQAELEFQARARVQEHTWNTKIQEAANAANKREEILRADADRARSAAIGLRGQLADINRRLPELAEQAVRQYAAALGDVFGECTERYTALAEKAGGHASDVQTLMGSWPR